MTPTVLIAFATKHGSTREVAEAVAARLQVHGLATQVRAAGDVAALDGYDAVVLGSAIYMGRLHEDARTFLRRHREGLAARPLAVFGMGPRTLSDEDVASSRRQLGAALGKEPLVHPVATTVFGGAFDPVHYRFPFNRMPASDVRDWAAIRAWGDEVATRLQLAEASTESRAS
jgi:menaquinone-dependent protoporphyrinogen oxidase